MELERQEDSGEIEVRCEKCRNIDRFPVEAVEDLLDDFDELTCGLCGGLGVLEDIETEDGTPETCPSCDGSGELDLEADTDAAA